MARDPACKDVFREVPTGSVTEDHSSRLELARRRVTRVSNEPADAEAKQVEELRVASLV